MWCIKKDGLYLSNQTVTHEDDYWVPSEITAQMTTSYAWVKDIEKAVRFMDRMSANSYLTRKRGEFWRGAEVVEE